MGEVDLSITSILRYGASTYPDATIHTYLGDRTVTHRYEEIAARSAQLAHALAELGVKRYDRVGTFCFNHHQHLEAYYAIPCSGAVLHTLNVRLFSEQLVYVINDAEDSIIIVDGVLLGLLARVLPSTPTVRALIIVGEADPQIREQIPLPCYDYEDLIAGRPTEYAWPDPEETDAVAMCYTSGTTGNPKGVVYSHRSTYLHSVSLLSASTLGLSPTDRGIVIVPMFHANAWGIPYCGFLAGSELIMPTRFLQAAPLADIINTLRPTFASGVPTIWNDLLHYGEDHPIDMSSFRLISAGGSAVPQAMIEAFRDRYQVELIQGWGMTETSPVCTLAIPPIHVTDPDKRLSYMMTAGHAVPGVELRITDPSGKVAPRDGETIGELEVRGPWITASYYHVDRLDSFRDGWLRTGDMGTIDSEGYLRIVDRTKDVIKSGGEWV
ncbi:MAG: long-chain-fatty-acid--CoA ligase, partial [Acidimicrobiales bacterium]